MCKLLLVHLYFIFGSCKVIRAPINMAVVVGDSLDMMCQPENGFIVRAWVYQQPFNSTDLKIYANWSTPKIHLSHFGFHTNINFSINIYVNSTGLEDAGTYNCSVQQGSKQLEVYSAQVTVLETEPACHSNSTLLLNASQEESYVWMQCTVNFRGNLSPHVEWRRHEGFGEEFAESQEITNLSNTEIIPNSRITSDVIVIFTSTNSPLSYSCKINFKPIIVTNVATASNAPYYSYRHTWKTPVTIVTSRPTHYRSDLPTILAALLVSLVVALSMAALIRYIIHRKTSNREPVNQITPITSRQATPILNVLECRVNQYLRKPKYVGDDGTEYMEVNSMGRQPMPVRLPAERKIVFSVVEEYASIDHTISPPIPPR